MVSSPTSLSSGSRMRRRAVKFCCCTSSVCLAKVYMSSGSWEEPPRAFRAFLKISSLGSNPLPTVKRPSRKSISAEVGSELTENQNGALTFYASQLSGKCCYKAEGQLTKFLNEM